MIFHLSVMCSPSTAQLHLLESGMGSGSTDSQVDVNPGSWAGRSLETRVGDKTLGWQLGQEKRQVDAGVLPIQTGNIFHI